jgi:hypothetical protein
MEPCLLGVVLNSRENFTIYLAQFPQILIPSALKELDISSKFRVPDTFVPNMQNT